jgi:hypothetical protein
LLPETYKIDDVVALYMLYAKLKTVQALAECHQIYAESLSSNGSVAAKG